MGKKTKFDVKLCSHTPSLCTMCTYIRHTVSAAVRKLVI